MLECVQFIGNESIRNVMSRSRFEDTVSNLYFSGNAKDDKSDKGCKVRSLVNHFNQSFSNSVTNDGSQSIDGHMVKFKGRSSMKEYSKNKPIKWGITFWYHCASERGYLYQFELYLGKKENAEENLGPGDVLKKTESLRNSLCFVFLIISSTVPHFIVFGRGLYDIGTARKDRK